MLGVTDTVIDGVIEMEGVADTVTEGVTDILTDGVTDTLGVTLAPGGTYALTCIISKPPPLPFLVRVKPP
jgi:hypothetical protein